MTMTWIRSRSFYIRTNLRLVVDLQTYIKAQGSKAYAEKDCIHEFRRTYATALIENNVDDKRVQNWMGHKNWSTTKNYYQYTDQVPDASASHDVSAAIWGKPRGGEPA